MSAILWGLAIVGAFVAALTVGVVSYLLVAVKLDHRAEAKRRAEQGRQVDAAYLASLAGHPAADRIRDQIAANEAARLDAEWEAMNR